MDRSCIDNPSIKHQSSVARNTRMDRRLPEKVASMSGLGVDFPAFPVSIGHWSTIIRQGKHPWQARANQSSGMSRDRA
jgi:hypothetical protein